MQPKIASFAAFREQAHPRLHQYLEQVEQEIVQLAEADLEVLRLGAEHAVGGRGKRLRPTLLLLAAEACQGQVDGRAILLSAAVEVIHTASLVHDDVVDEASWRRGLPSARSRWGNKISVLLGDYLLARAFDRLARRGELEAVRQLALVAGIMCRGQVQEIIGVNTPDEYLEMVGAKTAALFGLATRMGASLGQAENGLPESLERFGWNFGMAFQLSDDILDLTGSAELSGKPVVEDLRQRKLTLPLLYALGNGSEKIRRRLRSLLDGELGEAQVEAVRRLAVDAGGVDHAWQTARTFLGRAEKELSSVPDSEAKSALVMTTSGSFPLPVLA